MRFETLYAVPSPSMCTIETHMCTKTLVRTQHPSSYVHGIERSKSSPGYKSTTGAVYWAAKRLYQQLEVISQQQATAAPASAHDLMMPSDYNEMTTSSSYEALASLGQVQNELAVHSSASRAILTHVCERLARLETALAALQTEMASVRADTQNDVREVRSEVSGVQARVETIETQLSEYAGVMDLFQSEMNSHKSSLSWLSSSLTDEHGRVNDVHEKVDNQRDDFDNRFSELHLKLDELPRTLAALQATPTLRDTSFASSTADDKLLMQTHVHRRDNAIRSTGGGPYTDLEPFTIPDDMKAKVEARIRERELRKDEADALAATELSEAYRRLLLTSNPRLSDVRVQVDACQQQLAHAFQLIRDSNLHLYTCCAAKADKMDVASVHSELQAMRKRLRELEIAGTYRGRHPPPALSSSGSVVAGKPRGIETLAISTVKDRAGPDGAVSSSNNNSATGVPLVAAQVPELRVCLLELSRNFHVLQRAWTKRHQQQSLNPVVKVHMEKVVAMIADAYSATAEEPVDLVTVAQHVDKVARVLGSDFSIHVLSLLGYPNAQDEQLRLAIAASDTVPALCRYSELVTDSLRGSGQSLTGAAATAASSGPHSLERISLEVETLVRNQQRLESALEALTRTTATTDTLDVDGSRVSSLHSVMITNSSSSSSVDDALRQLRNELAAMRKQFVSEETLSAVLRQLEAWKTERDRSGSNSGGGASVVVGQRYPTSLFKRHNSVSGGSGGATLDSVGASDSLTGSIVDPLDRLKSQQPKLDPLHIHKLTGEMRPSRVQQQPHHHHSTALLASNGAAVLNGRSTAVSKMQARAQMMRPRSSVQPPHQ